MFSSTNLYFLVLTVYFFPYIAEKALKQSHQSFIENAQSFETWRWIPPISWPSLLSVCERNQYLILILVCTAFPRVRLKRKYGYTRYIYTYLTSLRNTTLNHYILKCQYMRKTTECTTLKKKRLLGKSFITHVPMVHSRAASSYVNRGLACPHNFSTSSGVNTNAI